MALLSAVDRTETTMDVEFETRWRELLSVLEGRFGGGMDLQDILYLVGVQELGQGFRNFRKDEKMDLSKS
jgi:hypothetical protein